MRGSTWAHRRPALLLTTFVILLGQAFLASAATVYTSPYTNHASSTNIIPDATGSGTSTATSSADKTTGNLSIFAESTSSAPTGVMVQPPYQNPIVGLGQTNAGTSATIINNGMTVSGAGTYSVTVLIDSINAANVLESDPAVLPYVYPSEVRSVSTAQAYIFCYWGTSGGSSAGIAPRSITSGSMTLTGSITCGGSGRINVSISFSGYTQAKGNAHGRLEASGRVASITIGP